MSFPYKKVLVIGATSGIGEALAARLVQEKSRVIVVGRRHERLDAFVNKHGKDMASAVPFNVLEHDKIPSFAASITKNHPDLDCVLLNAGIQRSLNFAKPETVDLSTVEMEFNANYFSQLAMTKAFLPFLQSKKEPTALIYTTSGLALIPLVRIGNYCASKAAQHMWIMALREQLRSFNIKVIELSPPAVQTELHDEKHQPDLKDGGSIGMPLTQFTDEAWAGLLTGEEEVVVGMAKEWYNAIEPARKKYFQQMMKFFAGSENSGLS